MNLKVIYFVVIGLTFMSCTTYTKKQCETMDWRKQGENFALKGQTLDQGYFHFHNACKDVVMDKAAFQAGHKEGLKIFCTAEYAENFAAEGGKYIGVCPETLENKNFLNKYHSSRENFLTKQIKELESDVSTLKRKNNDQEVEIAKLKNSLSTCEAK